MKNAAAGERIFTRACLVWISFITRKYARQPADVQILLSQVYRDEELVTGY